MDIRQAEPAPLEFVSQFLVVNPELVEKGGLQSTERVEMTSGIVTRKVILGQ